MIQAKVRGKCLYLSAVNRKKYKTTDWVYVFFRRHFELSYEVCGYFDNRPEINIALFFFHLTIKLPFYNKWTDECDPPKWGVAYHDNKFWVYKGGKGNWNGGNRWWTLSMPWEYTWVRTSVYRKDKTWEHEKRGDSKDFWDKEKWGDILWSETHPYTYILKSGTVQERTATIKIYEREWRQRWLLWTDLFSKKRRTIDVEFNDEVGEGTGSWKGGTLGCGYEMLPGEYPEQTLRRMEKERKF